MDSSTFLHSLHLRHFEQIESLECTVVKELEILM